MTSFELYLHYKFEFIAGNQNVPDLETILKTIRSAWNSPKSRSVFNRYVAKFNYYSKQSIYFTSIKDCIPVFNLPPILITELPFYKILKIGILE